MNFKYLALALCLLVVACAQGFAQTYNTFEGYSIIVDAADSGGSCAVNYGDNPIITKAGGGSITLYSCTSIGSVLGSGSSVTVTRDGTTGYWCFQGSESSYKVSFNSGAVTYAKWLPKTNSSGFYNVKDFDAKGNGTDDDTVAIKNAVAFVAAQKGGTLYFPEGTYLVGEGDDHRPITLPPGIVIQGATGLSPNFMHNYKTGTQFTTLEVKTANRVIFRIGECTADVKIKNVALTADFANTSARLSGTYGIEAVGAAAVPAHDSIPFHDSTSLITGLDDVSFSNLDIGFYAHHVGATTYGEWQFDHVKLDHCYFFNNKTAGIKISTSNTDWRISSSLFNLAGDAVHGIKGDGIDIVEGGAILLENSFAGGANDGNEIGGDFVNAVSVGALTIINCETEKTTNSLVFGNSAGTSGGNHVMLTLINNYFGDTVNLRARANLISTSNFYAAHTVQTTSAVKVYSTGDRFCYDATLGYIDRGSGNFMWPCGDVGPSQTVTSGGFQGGGKIMFETGQQRDYYGLTPTRVVEGRPMRIGSDVNIAADDDYPSNPSLSIMNNDYTKKLLQLGQFGTNLNYTIERDNAGWLSFKGTQGLPYMGFRFNAPVELPRINFADLPTGTPNSGAMVYCIDCKRHTAPCSTTGSGPDGAPAMVINGAWECN